MVPMMRSMSTAWAMVASSEARIRLTRRACSSRPSTMLNAVRHSTSESPCPSPARASMGWLAKGPMSARVSRIEASERDSTCTTVSLTVRVAATQMTIETKRKLSGTLGMTQKATQTTTTVATSSSRACRSVCRGRSTGWRRMRRSPRIATMKMPETLRSTHAAMTHQGAPSSTCGTGPTGMAVTAPATAAMSSAVR